VGLYGRLTGGAEGVRPRVWGMVEELGYGLLGLAGVGLGLQALRRWLAPPEPPAGTARRPERTAGGEER
jgi:hypothetical protein